MTRVAVVGLGAMGLGIAQVFAASGALVVATDASPAMRDSALDRLAAELGARVASGKLTPEARDATLARVQIVQGPDRLGPADLVVEAIIEDAGAKAALLAALEKAMPATTVLASNTSSLSIRSLAEGLTHPGRLVGLHFFNPAPAMRLVELIAHPGTLPEAMTLARDMTEAAGKTVIRAPDSPGFIVNRCARPYYGEALAMLEEGRDARDIDAAMLAAGYRLGPFSLIDLIGSDINLAATEGLYAALDRHPRYFPFAALRRRVLSGHLGRKSGMGFVHPDAPGAPPADAEAIALRIETALVNEAGWLLAGGDVTAGDIDTAMRLGLNFPRGPFEMLAAQGAARIRDTLAALGRAAPAHLAGRYDPAPILG